MGIVGPSPRRDDETRRVTVSWICDSVNVTGNGNTTLCLRLSRLIATTALSARKPSAYVRNPLECAAGAADKR